MHKVSKFRNPNNTSVMIYLFHWEDKSLLRITVEYKLNRLTKNPISLMRNRIGIPMKRKRMVNLDVYQHSVLVVNTQSN